MTEDTPNSHQTERPGNLSVKPRPLPARCICLLMAWLTALMPVHRAMADAMSDSARVGQAVARQSAQGFALPQSSPDGQGLTLFPGSARQLSVGTGELFPASGSASSSDFAKLYGDDNGTVAAGLDAQAALPSDGSLTGEAYRALTRSANRPHPDLSKDPVWGLSDHVADTQSLFNSQFADCASTTIDYDGHYGARLPDYQTCVRGPRVSSRCEFAHELEVAPVIQPVSGPSKVEKCGEGCIDVWVGQIGDNYWKASCAFFEAAVSFNVVPPNAITEAKLEEVYWDDYIQVYVDGDAVFDTRPNLSRCDAHPPNNHFLLYPFTDVTARLRPQGQHTLKLRVLVGNGGEGYARIRIRFDPIGIYTTFPKNWWAVAFKLSNSS